MIYTIQVVSIHTYPVKIKDREESSDMDTMDGRKASVVRKLALSYFNPAVQLYIDDVSNDEMHVRCN